MGDRALTLVLKIDDSQASAALSRYKTAMQGMANNNQQMQTSMTNLNKGYADFNRLLNTTFLGLSVMKIAQLAGEMNELGQKVNIAKLTFTALAGGADSAQAMLELMSQRTNGVVDNLTLMSGASRLLQMGLGDTKEEISGLTEMAVKLGGALGMGPNKAIEDFSLLLSNMSFLRKPKDAA